MSPSKMGFLVQAARPRQWLKNLLVFAAIVFSQRLTEPSSLVRTCGAFGIFCALSSAVYLFNDLVDMEQDKRHPVKSQRPIAAGNLGRGEAMAAAIVLATLGIVAGFALSFSFGWVGIGYLALQVSYCLWLKHVVVLDVLLVSIGFVLRALAGGCAIGVSISHWLMLCTLFLALFLIVCKRRHELVLLGENSVLHRRTLRDYSPAMLDQMVAVVTSSTIICYALYTVAPETVARFGGDQLVYTVPFVVFGIFRYLFLVYQREEGGEPDGLMLLDRPLLLGIVLYAIAVIVLVYGPQFAR